MNMAEEELNSIKQKDIKQEGIENWFKERIEAKLVSVQQQQELEQELALRIAMLGQLMRKTNSAYNGNISSRSNKMLVKRDNSRI